jgi:Mg-chelatase subunit ChlD
MKRLMTIFLFLALFFPVQMQLAHGQENQVSALADSQDPKQKMDIVLVLDNSGSMKKNDPELLARDMVTDFLIELGNGTRLGMVIFDRTAELAESLIDMTKPEAKASFLKSLNRVNYSGSFSDSPAAIERAIYELKTRGRKDARKAIVFLTDGIVDTGDKARDREKETWLKQDLAQGSKKEGIRIFGIAFSNSADFSIIQTLAFKTDGEYFRVYNVVDIHRVFKKLYEIITEPPIETAPRTIAKTVAIVPTPRETKPARPQPKKIETVVPSVKVTVPPRKESLYFQAFLAGIIVLLGIIIIIMLFKGRSKPLASDETAAAAAPREEPSIPQALLVDVKNITSKKTLILDKKVTSIGRGSNNDVAIAQDTVSGFHATIEYRNDTFYLEDQRSTNKTYLNGEDIKPYSPKRLKSGDEIIFADFRFVFLIAYQTPAGETTRVG